ncbi:hypothetical protein [Massilia terrae]|uniref:Uncharacterized protein n=1 Tax=Massilia terrae TaxID=1811224 RepID=A0ABT2D681_9BURK|nr:hypothetical protein [Massilia terrae]MCS0660875.1 hypothetical protein [Massilia terrae]
MQNLIQFGNFLDPQHDWAMPAGGGWAEETSAAGNSVFMPHFTDRFDEKF